MLCQRVLAYLYSTFCFCILPVVDDTLRAHDNAFYALYYYFDREFILVSWQFSHESPNYDLPLLLHHMYRDVIHRDATKLKTSIFKSVQNRQIFILPIFPAIWYIATCTVYTNSVHSIEWFLWTIEHTNSSLDNSKQRFAHHGLCQAYNCMPDKASSELFVCSIVQRNHSTLSTQHA